MERTRVLLFCHDMPPLIEGLSPPISREPEEYLHKYFIFPFYLDELLMTPDSEQKTYESFDFYYHLTSKTKIR